ncbi:MAG: restriction endonuclease subunit S, partial [Cetobacterium sp.]
MSKLEQLINELCPDGVEWKTLGDIFNILAGGDVPKGNLSDIKIEEFNIPILSNGINEKSLYGWTNIAKIVEPSLTISARGTIGWVSFREEPFFPIVRLLVLTPKIELNLKFVYYFMKMIENDYKVPTTGIPQLTKPMINNIEIPLPPLAVQEEIVRILDTFTELTTELATELTTELTMRKQQYEYYRDSLLINNKLSERVLLNSVIKKGCSGGTPRKGEEKFYLNGTIPWLRTQDVKFNEIFEVKSFITEEAVKKTSAKWIPSNCVIVAISGATAGRCAINKIPTTTNQHCYNMEIDDTKALYKYIYYCVCSQYEELLSRKQGARGDLNSSLITGISIPLPSLEEQQRIVDILDRFDTLVNDIKEGLPAEIEARKQQYEYYRDKLLTF